METDLSKGFLRCIFVKAATLKKDFEFVFFSVMAAITF